MLQFVAVCLAGALGTGVRYGVSTWSLARFGDALPVGTLIVNLVGCFVMALVVHTPGLGANVAALRPAITAGFLGGLTTYSAFNAETMKFLDEQPLRGALYVGCTLFGCVACALLGAFVARNV